MTTVCNQTIYCITEMLRIPSLDVRIVVYHHISRQHQLGLRVTLQGLAIVYIRLQTMPRTISVIVIFRSKLKY